MLRTVVAVVAGYFAIVLFTFVVFSCLYLLLGAEGAYRPGSYEVSGLWVTLSMVVGLIAGMVGGGAAMLIGQKSNAPLALAAAVLAFGLFGAVSVMQKNRAAEAPPPREADVRIVEAMRHSRQPTWVAFCNPVLGVAGVMLGAGIVRRKAGPATA